MDTDVFELNTPKAIVLSGLIGSIVSLSFVDGLSYKQRIAAVVSGMVMSHYLAPMIAHVFREEGYEETIGFLIGLFGMSIAASIFRAIQNSDIWALVKKRFANEADK